MTSDQPNPLIDFSNAKEPPRSIDIDKAQEADPIEPEEVTGESKSEELGVEFNS